MVLIVMINLVYWWVPMILILLLVQVEGDAIVQGGGGLEDCMETRCDQNGPAVRFPFRIKGRQPIRCGLPGFDISCSDQNETILVMPSSEGSFVISDINYKSQGMVGAFQGCLPRDIFHKNGSSPFKFVGPATIFSCPPSIVRDQYSSGLRGDLLRMYPCHGNNLAGNHYAVIASGFQIVSLPLLSCTKMYDYTSRLDPEDIYESYYRYYPCQKLRWSIKSCRHCEEIRKTCGLKIINNFTNDQTHHQIQCLGGKNGIFTGRRGRNRLKILGICGLCFAVIATGMAIYSVYSSNKTEKEIRLRIKTFLDDYKALKPSRYSYADIKRITNQFEENLGQGAYGTVFKGKLSSELLVAVKILNNSNENGEDFINEVGTLCQIHHVNVVRLVGFCADGFIRALVYEFFPKGPLQNFLSSADDKDTFLGWEKLQDIALGIAKGIEYLHQGCDQRILHFDIKPHNVLLDEDFTPKVSDFGLAKFCSKDQSAISMTTARGTMGYIAPEVFSRNFGNVSYKSDVYSFGILLLEMVGGKKNKVTEDNSPTSQFYFPEWIYNLLEQGNDLRIHIGDEGDVGIARKLAIVGLWCIQWHPIDRPSMKVVVQMLEREGDDNLTMPPNPFASASN